MNAPIVSVLVPLYNSAATIERALRSAMRQTLADIEILLGDDASTDAGSDIAQRLASEEPRLRVFRFATNGGKPRVMNRLIEAANGEFLAVLDADDAYAPDRLERLVAACCAHGTEMAADNLLYVDSGVPGEGFGEVVRTGFPVGAKPLLLDRQHLFAAANTYADFDPGILKPIIRRDFAARHALRYIEQSRLAEDFTYLLRFFLAGGRAVLLSEPLYYWTMPFGAHSRRWTETGAGPWRYDYRPALAVNTALIRELRASGEPEAVRMLHRRGRQYRAMIAYIEAQRMAASGRPAAAMRQIATHPEAWELLARRLAGRAVRALRIPAGDAKQNQFSRQRVA